MIERSSFSVIGVGVCCAVGLIFRDRYRERPSAHNFYVRCARDYRTANLANHIAVEMEILHIITINRLQSGNRLLLSQIQLPPHCFFMNEPHPSSSSLREPLLDPEVVANSEYIVSCTPLRNRSLSDSSAGLEDMLRSWWHNQPQQQQQNENDAQGCNNNGDIISGSQHRSLPQDEENEADNNLQLRSERPCRPWYKNPLQIMAMISNFSTSFNVVNISLVLQIFKIVFQDVHSVKAEDEVSWRKEK